MSLLATINTPKDLNTPNEDRVTMGRSFIVESGVYPAEIIMAYLQKTSKGSIGLHMEFALDVGNDEPLNMRKTLYLTSSATGQPYYEKNGKRNVMTDYLHACDMALFATKGAKSFETRDAFTDASGVKHNARVALDEEMRTIKVYDFEAKREVEKEMPVLPELLGAKIQLGIIKEVKNKQQRDANGDYQDTAKKQEVNNIDKVFHATNDITSLEGNAGITKGEFIKSWKEHWEGKTVDNYTAIESSADTSGTGTPTSLF